jgi:hypothetical protein
MADADPTPVANGGWLRAWVILGVLGLGGVAVAGVSQNWSGIAAGAALAAGIELVFLLFLSLRRIKADPFAPAGKPGPRGWITVATVLGLLYVKSAFVAAWFMDFLGEDGLGGLIGPKGLVVLAVLALIGVEVVAGRIFRRRDQKAAEDRKPPLVLSGE